MRMRKQMTVMITKTMMKRKRRRTKTTRADKPKASQQNMTTVPHSRLWIFCREFGE
jgi:hypothetical protein